MSLILPYIAPLLLLLETHTEAVAEGQPDVVIAATGGEADALS